METTDFVLALFQPDPFVLDAPDQARPLVADEAMDLLVDLLAGSGDEGGPVLGPEQGLGFPPGQRAVLLGEPFEELAARLVEAREQFGGLGLAQRRAFRSFGRGGFDGGGRRLRFQQPREQPLVDIQFRDNFAVEAQFEVHHGRFPLFDGASSERGRAPRTDPSQMPCADFKRPGRYGRGSAIP